MTINVTLINKNIFISIYIEFYIPVYDWFRRRGNFFKVQTDYFVDNN